MQAELSYGTPAAFDAALDDLDASLTRYQSIGDRRGQADARRWLGQVRAIRPDADPVAACREHRVVVDIARQLGDVDREARALYALGDARFAADELSRAREQFERALSLFAEEDRLAWTIIVRRRLAIIAVLCGAFDRARDRLETALSDVRTIDRPEMESRVHRALAVVYCYTHDLSRAADHARDSLKLARTLDDGTRIVRACQSLGRAQLHAGAVDAAETTATRLRAAERAYDVDGASAALCARVALARGDHATARNHATCGLDGPEPEGRYQIVLGRIALATGALDEARDYCTDTVQDQYGDEHRYWTQHALVDRARAHRHAGAFDAAATDLQAALDSTDVDPYPLPAARVTLQRGALARARGSLDRAQTLLDRAQDRCETLDTPRLVARTQFERGLLTAARGDIETAHDLLRTAADRCRDLGARAQEARMLAALIDLGPALDGDDLDRYRTRYETLDCEHVPVCHDQCDVTPQPSP
jgi:tetratricopeptide (TPR) repeat protein